MRGITHPARGIRGLAGRHRLLAAGANGAADSRSSWPRRLPATPDASVNGQQPRSCCPNPAGSRPIRPDLRSEQTAESPAAAYRSGLSALSGVGLLSGGSRFDSWRDIDSLGPAIQRCRSPSTSPSARTCYRGTDRSLRPGASPPLRPPTAGRPGRAGRRVPGGPDHGPRPTGSPAVRSPPSAPIPGFPPQLPHRPGAASR
jgi:hypothetical protein